MVIGRIAMMMALDVVAMSEHALGLVAGVELQDGPRRSWRAAGAMSDAALAAAIAYFVTSVLLSVHGHPELAG
jgi:hypothetical protein